MACVIFYLWQMASSPFLHSLGRQRVVAGITHELYPRCNSLRYGPVLHYPNVFCSLDKNATSKPLLGCASNLIVVVK